MPEQDTEKTPCNTPFRWQSHGITHVGRVRKLNEDALLCRPQNGLWAVADGMGGHAAGEVASQLIVENLGKLPEHSTLAEFVNATEDALLHTNESLLEMTNERTDKETVGSTVAMMHASGKFCYYAWLGDSRVYRLRGETLRQITTDHSQVEHHIEMGLISRREALAHPQGNIITRAVGVTENMHLDMDMQEMQDGDRYLLCSDGLTRHIDDIELQDLLRENTPEELCAKLVDITLERGASDNVTVVIVDISSDEGGGGDGHDPVSAGATADSK